MRDDEGVMSTTGPPSPGGQGGLRQKIEVRVEICAREADKVMVLCVRKFQ